jgi:ariadne-1
VVLKCNRYDGSDINSQVTAAQKAKAELDRYIHYCQRFHGHDQGLIFTAKQREAAEQKLIEQQRSKGSSWLDV